MVAVTVKVAPVQLAVAGVTVYVAVCGVFVGLVKVPKIVLWEVPAAPPVTAPVTVGIDQLYVVAAGTILLVVAFTGLTVKPLPLQAAAV